MAVTVAEMLVPEVFVVKGKIDSRELNGICPCPKDGVTQYAAFFFFFFTVIQHTTMKC